MHHLPSCITLSIEPRSACAEHIHRDVVNDGEHGPIRRCPYQVMLRALADHLREQVQRFLVARVALEGPDERGRTEAAVYIRVLREPPDDHVPVARHFPVACNHFQGHCAQLGIATVEQRLHDRERLTEVVLPEVVDDMVGFFGR